MGKKAEAGTVAVGVDRGRLRLVWSYLGRRYTMALGLPDSPINRRIAEGKASIIYGDIISGNFDRGLEKYRAEGDRAEPLTAASLVDRWIEFKAQQKETARAKYGPLGKQVREFFKSREARAIDEEEAHKFRDWLLKQNSPATTKGKIGHLRSCWNWGIKRKLVIENPWTEVKLKVPPIQKKPFTLQEIGLILAQFRGDPRLLPYADFVEFLLSVGCRPGEAIGLRWRHLTPDCSAIWIGESLGRERVTKPTKTNKDRAFQLSPKVAAMLRRRKPKNAKPDDLVFTTATGKQIIDSYFRRVFWLPALEAAGVPYRRPYNSRHTFISWGVDSGIHPIEISEITGHTPETLYKNYLGSVRGKVRLPEVFGAAEDP